MKLFAIVAGSFVFFHTSVSAESFQRPEQGLTFGAIQKINGEVQRMYEERLKNYMVRYVKGILQFTTRHCQIRDPQLGCLTFVKTHQARSMQVDFNTPAMLKLQGFERLLFIRENNQRQSMRLFDREGRVIRFPFQKGQIQAPFVPFAGGTIRYDQLEMVFLNLTVLYEESLKEAMQQYSSEQWTYPQAPCDRDFLALGCASYRKNDWVWLMVVRLNPLWQRQLAGFRQILFRHRADGLGELEIQNPQQQSLYFPIATWQLKDLFVPMPLAPNTAPAHLETSLLK